MNLKRSFVLTALICLTTTGYSQSAVYLESFASTGFGLSINYEKQIELTKNSKIGIPIGLGLRHQSAFDPTFWLYKTGVNYYYKYWGLGIDASFHNALGALSETSYADTKVILYPNLNYRWYFASHWYVKPSVGIAFSYFEVINPEMSPQVSQKSYWGNSLVFFGISIGRSF